MILFYEAGKEGENKTTWSFLLLFHITIYLKPHFFLLFHFQNKETTSPSHSLSSHRQDLSILFSSPTLYRTLRNLKFKFYRLKPPALYHSFSFGALSYGCQLQQDDFLIHHLNLNPSSRTTEEWKGVPEVFFFPFSYSLYELWIFLSSLKTSVWNYPHNSNPNKTKIY